MKTFNYESRSVKYNNCFFDIGKYKDGQMSLSIYGNVENDKNVSHISSPTVNVKDVLSENQVVIDNNVNTNLIGFLLELGIIQGISRRIVVDSKILPVVELNLDTLYEYSYSDRGLDIQDEVA